MTSELQILGFDGHPVRACIIDGEPFFVANDIAKLLKYTNPSKATNDHCKKAQMRWGNDSLGRQQQFKVIPESDVYRLVFKSNMPGAERLTDWVSDEVIPNIRKHGAYMTSDTIEKSLTNPDFIIQLAMTLKEEQAKVNELKQINEAMQPKVKYFDVVMERGGLTSFRDTAKMLGMKQTEFIDWLLDFDYIYRDKKGRLMPYSQYCTKYFEVKEFVNDDNMVVGIQTLITAEGRARFNQRINGSKEE